MLSAADSAVNPAADMEPLHLPGRQPAPLPDPPLPRAILARVCVVGHYFAMRRRRLCAVVAFTVGLALPTLDAAADSSPVAERIDSGLLSLHQGLYGRAEGIFQSAALAAPDDPEPQLFIAFDRWWRILLEERGGRENDASFDAAVDAAIGLADARLATAPDDPRPMAAAGAARILRSHMEAMHHNYFRAAQEARRGKKILEAALKRDPTANPALFALGALNYFADKVPAIVKGLRALLFLPGGDAELGLTQLKTVASSSGPFRTDARLLLAILRGSREEACFEESIQALRETLGENAGSPLILGSIGEIQMRMGDYPAAAASFDEALGSAGGEDLDRARQRRFLRPALAEALAADWRLERAAEILRQADADPGPMSQAARRARGRVERDLDSRRESAPPVVLRALEAGHRTEAIESLNDAIAATPDRASMLFLRGHLFFLEGQRIQAQADLEAADRLASDPPAWMEGWTQIDLGLIARQSGHERAARSHFHRASEVRSFRSDDRGVLEMNAGAARNPVCGP